MKHGHVSPLPDGARARCGGPVLCSDCALEWAALTYRPAKGDPTKPGGPNRPAVAAAIATLLHEAGRTTTEEEIGDLQEAANAVCSFMQARLLLVISGGA